VAGAISAVGDGALLLLCDVCARAGDEKSRASLCAPFRFSTIRTEDGYLAAAIAAAALAPCAKLPCPDTCFASPPPRLLALYPSAYVWVCRHRHVCRMSVHAYRETGRPTRAGTSCKAHIAVPAKSNSTTPDHL